MGDSFVRKRVEAEWMACIWIVDDVQAVDEMFGVVGFECPPDAGFDGVGIGVDGREHELVDWVSGERPDLPQFGDGTENR